MKTIDERLESAAHDVQRAVTQVPARPAEGAVRGHRVARVARAAAVMALAVAAIGGTALLMDGDGGGEVAGGSDFRTTLTSPSSDTDSVVIDGTVVLGGETFPVGDVVEAFGDAPVLEAVGGNDSTAEMMLGLGLGEEAPLDVATPKVADPDIIDGPAIYLGDVEGDSAFLTEETYGEEPQKCLWIGPTPQVCGDYGMITIHPANEVSATVWLGVPQGTVAVALFEETGYLLGWQQPRSRVVVITVEVDDPQRLAMVAFDADGQEILRVGQFEAGRETSDGSPTEGVTTTQP